MTCIRTNAHFKVFDGGFVNEIFNPVWDKNRMDVWMFFLLPNHIDMA